MLEQLAELADVQDDDVLIDEHDAELADADEVEIDDVH